MTDDDLGARPTDTLRVEADVTERANAAIQAAWREAERRSRNYINTGDLLLGLLADPNSPAAIALWDLGVDQEKAERALDILYMPTKAVEDD